MNKREKEKLLKKRLYEARKRHMIIGFILVVCAIVIVLLAALIPFGLHKKDKIDVQSLSTEDTTIKEETIPQVITSETESETETESHIVITASPETESSESEETTEEETTPAPVPEEVSYDDVVFIGDSRTLTMANGGTLEFNLVPKDRVFATWGGQLVDESAFKNAWDAGQLFTRKAVFWFGINDVQVNPNRDDANGFVENYKQVVNQYKMLNLDSEEIYIVSVLNTTVREKDYYEGQEANIAAYNAALERYCAENDYIYLDATSLLTGDECFYEGDNIHFSKEWYENSYLPFIWANVLHIGQ